MLNKSAPDVEERTRRYGELLYRRAIGEAAEPEAAKSLCEIVSRHYSPGMRVLDAGCGAGHLLRSLRERVDPRVDYLGIEKIRHYVELAQRAFPMGARFQVGDIFNLNFAPGAFDLVISSNVIPNLSPPPTRAFEELIRVSKDTVIIRALFSDLNYIIQEIAPAGRGGEKHLISVRGGAREGDFIYNNMYTESYYREIIQDADPKIEIDIVADTASGNFDNRDSVGAWGTRVEGGKQISGQLVLDWRYLILAKKSH